MALYKNIAAHITKAPQACPSLHLSPLAKSALCLAWVTQASSGLRYQCGDYNWLHSMRASLTGISQPLLCGPQEGTDGHPWPLISELCELHKPTGLFPTRFSICGKQPIPSSFCSNLRAASPAQRHLCLFGHQHYFDVIERSQSGCCPWEMK